MLLYKIKELECLLESEGKQESKEYKAVKSLKASLLKIDFKTEYLFENSFNNVTNLLNDVNNRALTKEEVSILKKIMQN